MTVPLLGVTWRRFGELFVAPTAASLIISLVAVWLLVKVGDPCQSAGGFSCIPLAYSFFAGVTATAAFATWIEGGHRQDR